MWRRNKKRQIEMVSIIEQSIRPSKQICIISNFDEDLFKSTTVENSEFTEK